MYQNQIRCFNIFKTFFNIFIFLLVFFFYNTQSFATDLTDLLNAVGERSLKITDNDYYNAVNYSNKDVVWIDCYGGCELIVIINGISLDRNSIKLTSAIPPLPKDDAELATIPQSVDITYQISPNDILGNSSDVYFTITLELFSEFDDYYCGHPDKPYADIYIGCYDYKFSYDSTIPTSFSSSSSSSALNSLSISISSELSNSSSLINSSSSNSSSNNLSQSLSSSLSLESSFESSSLESSEASSNSESSTLTSSIFSTLSSSSNSESNSSICSLKSCLNNTITVACDDECPSCVRQCPDGVFVSCENNCPAILLSSNSSSSNRRICHGRCCRKK
ncbi:MAG: hypothetical protein LBE20_00710 [Deltaproteobacteria bacterium]|jgi:hypothetical protein|nr:hypothetical protein [Deltaproteobacteria bacterium]